MDKKLFQEYELDAFLGDFRDDYDVDGIIDEATEMDYSTGNRYWKDVDLAEVCQRHDMVRYLVTEGYDDGSEKDERMHGTEDEAREDFDGIDLVKVYRTEWMCLPTGGRGRHKARRYEKELIPVKVSEGVIEEYRDPVEYESIGYDELKDKL